MTRNSLAAAGRSWLASRRTSGSEVSIVRIALGMSSEFSVNRVKWALAVGLPLAVGAWLLYVAGCLG